MDRSRRAVLRGRLDDREVADPDSLSFYPLGGAEADFQAGVVLGDARFEPVADFFIGKPMVVGTAVAAQAITGRARPDLKANQQPLIVRARIRRILRGF